MRELHDKYFRLAKRENKLARSYYKLAEIDKREKLFHHTRRVRVVDLGAAPGSWLEYVLEKVAPTSIICAVDLQIIAKKFKSIVHFKKHDVHTLPSHAFVDVVEKFDIVLSDMAPNTSGIKLIDQARSLELCERAAEFARNNLAVGGFFICKIFESSEVGEFRQQLQREYGEVKLFKPDASRDESFEIYLIGREFTGGRGSVRAENCYA